jgi:hypothetical protein
METTVELVCPYCGELSFVRIEFGIRRQDLLEACNVCSRPIKIKLQFDRNYDWDLQIRRASGL